MNSKLRKVGNGVGVLIPSPLAARLVVSPKESVVDEKEFERHMTAVLQKYDGLFRRLADA